MVAATQAAPETTTPPPGHGKVIAYQTDRRVRFTVAFFAADGSVLLSTPNFRQRLQPVPAASGAKYSDGVITFWSKGEEASVEVEGKILYRGLKIKGEERF